MHQKEENLTENHITPIISEIHTEPSINEENSRLFKKGKTKGRNLKSEKSQDYAQKPQLNRTFMNSISELILINPTQ
jgi:hypothetical protein